MQRRGYPLPPAGSVPGHGGARRDSAVRRQAARPRPVREAAAMRCGAASWCCDDGGHMGVQARFRPRSICRSQLLHDAPERLVLSLSRFASVSPACQPMISELADSPARSIPIQRAIQSSWSWHLASLDEVACRVLHCPSISVSHRCIQSEIPEDNNGVFVSMEIILVFDKMPMRKLWAPTV
ncbi:unnamed protein product [Urochloa humidicola]